MEERSQALVNKQPAERRDREGLRKRGTCALSLFILSFPHSLLFLIFERLWLDEGKWRAGAAYYTLPVSKPFSQLSAPSVCVRVYKHTRNQRMSVYVREREQVERS